MIESNVPELLTDRNVTCGDMWWVGYGIQNAAQSQEEWDKLGAMIDGIQKDFESGQA